MQRPKSACLPSRKSAGNKRPRPEGNETRLFSFHDTSNRSYEHVRAALLRRGWRPAKSGRGTPRLSRQAVPDLIWTLSPEEISFASLAPQQIVNHYQGIECITTKIGLVSSLRQAAPLFREPPTGFSPRAYQLEDSQQVAEFVDDFRTTAAFNLLEVFAHREGQQLYPGEDIQHSLHVVNLCIQFAQCALRAVASGEHAGVDYEPISKLVDDDWEEIMELSYKAAAVVLGPGRRHVTTNSQSSIDTEALVKEARRLTTLIRLLWPQRSIDGHRNMWVVKAPDAARGTGIQLCHRLDMILERQKGMRGRVVQKYVEHPLLKPSAPPVSADSEPPPMDTPGFKFDLRVWVLLVGVKPMNVYCFNRCYGRVCSKPYSSSITTLDDPRIHLTNYAIHKDACARNLSVELVEGDDELLLAFEQLLQLLGDCENSGQAGGAHVWAHAIWPRVRQIITATVESALPQLQPYPLSFELLGFDILLDNKLNPWLLEVNMSPSIASRGIDHELMVASMSEGLVALAIDQTPGKLPVRPSPKVAEFGEWELIAQFQTNRRQLRSADPRLRVDGRAVCELQIHAIDVMCEQTIQATKIQRWWTSIRRLRAKNARRRLRTLLGMPTSPIR